MLKLATDPKPHTVELLDGVRLTVRPITALDVLVARAAAAQVYRDDHEAEEKNPDVATAATTAMVRSFAHRTITGWEGIEEEAGGPAPVTAQNIDRLMTFWPVYESFDLQVVVPALRG